MARRVEPSPRRRPDPVWRVAVQEGKPVPDGTTAGVIGPGSMGEGMALSCLRAGLPDFGFDIDTAPARAPRPVRRAVDAAAAKSCARAAGRILPRGNRCCWEP